jgi:hypothetical protein
MWMKTTVSMYTPIGKVLVVVIDQVGSGRTVRTKGPESEQAPTGRGTDPTKTKTDDLSTINAQAETAHDICSRPGNARRGYDGPVVKIVAYAALPVRYSPKRAVGSLISAPHYGKGLMPCV